MPKAPPVGRRRFQVRTLLRRRRGWGWRRV